MRERVREGQRSWTKVEDMGERDREEERGGEGSGKIVSMTQGQKNRLTKLKKCRGKRRVKTSKKQMEERKGAKGANEKLSEKGKTAIWCMVTSLSSSCAF